MKTGDMWALEAYHHEIPSDSEWVTRAPTGYGQGRCRCGWTTDDHGKAIRSELMAGALLAHIQAEHADWPAEALEPLRRATRPEPGDLTSGLVAFLRARLDEDEQAARDADGASWYFDYIDDSARPFHERFIPPRVLLDVGAKRWIVDEYAAAFARTKRHPGDVATSADFTATLRLVKMLALPYAGHDDYDESWRP